MTEWVKIIPTEHLKVIRGALYTSAQRPSQFALLLLIDEELSLRMVQSAGT